MIESATVKLSASEFDKLSNLIYRECGINLTIQKKVLVESRLQKRLANLKLQSFSDYYALVTRSQERETELVQLIDAVTTNKTDFFREPVHFQFMREVIPFLSGRSVKVWSSACSTGEEPYTIAMVLQELASNFHFDYKIFATDISTRAIQKGAEAIYPERTIGDIPMELRKKYLLRSKAPDNPTVRFVPSIRSKVQFKRLNLMDDVLEADRDFDFIFCRNVLIYFDRQTQENVIRKLLQHLKSGGYLFIGHSESIYQMSLPIQQLKPTIFQKL